MSVSYDCNWKPRNFCPECHREFERDEIIEHLATCECGKVCTANETWSFEDMIDRNLIKAHKPWTMETALAQLQYSTVETGHCIKFNDAFIWMRNHAKEIDEYLASK